MQTNGFPDTKEEINNSFLKLQSKMRCPMEPNPCNCIEVSKKTVEEAYDSAWYLSMKPRSRNGIRRNMVKVLNRAILKDRLGLHCTLKFSFKISDGFHYDWVRNMKKMYPGTIHHLKKHSIAKYDKLVSWNLAPPESYKPFSIKELNERFPTRWDALLYLADIRWGKFVRCPFCNNGPCSLMYKNMKPRPSHIVPIYHCCNCRSNFRALYNTPLQASVLPLYNWIFGAYFLLSTPWPAPSLREIWKANRRYGIMLGNLYSILYRLTAPLEWELPLEERFTYKLSRAIHKDYLLP